jgi:hypothetical protein
MSNNRTAGLAILACLLVAGYALINVDTLWGEYAQTQIGYTGYRLALQLLLYAVSGVALGALLIGLNRYLMVLAILVLVTVITTNRMAIELLQLTIVDRENAEWLLAEVRSAPDAMSQFRGTLARQVVIALGLLAPFIGTVIYARRGLRADLRSPALLSLAALGVYGLSGALLYHSFKPRIPIDGNLVFFAVDLALRPTPDIPPVDLKAARPPQAQKIVLLVDESLTYRGYAAELSARWSRWSGVDFGEALSLGNCSAPSNAILRWGFRAQPMLSGEDPRRQPMIWSYARAAGFETYLLDGQHNGAYQNMMTGKEAALIDHYLGASRGMETDHQIAEQLHELLLKPGRMFIYVNKRGDHFPYVNNFPQELFPQARTNEQHYAASIRYSSADFLDTMLSGVPMTDVLVLYTSDHGDRFDGIGISHCNAVPSLDEIRVPLVLLSGNDVLARQAAAAAVSLKNRAGHEQIFATLLAAMGFDVKAAENLYGSSLLSASVPQHYYHVLLHPIAINGVPAVTEIERPAFHDPEPLGLAPSP